MFQMQKRHAEARARTRKTTLDRCNWRRKFDLRFGHRYRRVTEDMFQNLMDRHHFSLNINFLFKYAFKHGLTYHRS